MSAGNVRTLVEDKLRPLGILAAADGSSPAIDKPDPLLALRFHRAIIRERASYTVARLFKPLFFPPMVLAALVALGAFDVWLFVDHGVAQAFRQSLESPGYMLLALGLVVISAGWHEFGHAAGCAYGGARPGVMGAGIYLVYPAFYTDVTDSYRLDRRGKLRTDLAGVYFNGLFILVPDLFSGIKPILVSVLPWKPAGPRVHELKPWVRMVVTVWVMIVVPLLLFQVGMILLHIPRIFATAWDSLGKQTDSVSKAVGKADVISAGVGIVQSLILVLPILGIVLISAASVSGWR